MSMTDIVRDFRVQWFAVGVELVIAAVLATRYSNLGAAAALIWVPALLGVVTGLEVFEGGASTCGCFGDLEVSTIPHYAVLISLMAFSMHNLGQPAMLSKKPVEAADKGLVG